MNPFSSGTRLRDMIRAIRACKTAAEERAVVRKECAAIRAAFSGNDQDCRHRNLAKLMFIHILGYPTHFGRMECLKLIASGGFPEKRIGYLGLMLLLDERQEVLMLVTNSLKQDLNHSNQYIVGLALCALGNICSAEMARDLAPEVERLLQLRDPNIRKKAALCSIRIIKKVPDLAENFISPAAALLKEKHHGVLITGVQLCTDLCKVSAEALEYFRKDSDSSIRKRSLELIFLLANDSNFKPLIKELIDYLELSNHEFKGILTAKICSIVEKFSSDKMWYIDHMLKVLSVAGNFVKDEVWHALIVVISNASQLHGYTVRSLYRAFQTSSEQESLVRVAVWCIGEYGEMLVNNIGMLDKEEPITFVQLHLDPTSSNTLPASGSESVTQSLRVTNSQHGQKPLAMRIRIAYKVNNQDVLEQGQINNFPAGL